MATVQPDTPAADSTAIDRLLYGSDPATGIVAVEQAGPGAMRVYWRRATGRQETIVESTVEPFAPWMFLTQEPTWPQLAGKYEIERLAGAADYCWLARFTQWPAFLTARALLDDAGQRWLGFPSPVEQYLAASGRTLFKDLTYDDLIRLQLDIETSGLDPRAPDAKILLVVVGANGGVEEAIGAGGEDERTILHRLNELIAKIDPDIIEGHNIFNFDLPYLLTRAAAVGVSLTWGRDGSPVTAGSSQRFKVAARSIPFQPHYIHGRHLLDTYQQIQRYDSAGALTSYGLKQAIDALGLTREDRTFVRGESLNATWELDREKVIRYALDDIRDVAALSAVTVPTEFYQTQILPQPLQKVATSGTGGKVNALVLRAHVAARESVPQPQPPQAYPGGYSEVRAVGIFRPVVKCDVESLYPAIMLTEGISSARDRLGIMLPLLRELTTRRLDAKQRARLSAGREHAYWQGLQGSFKVLINSFYGYLGYSRAVLNDYAAAERITLRGQELIKVVVAELERTGARVIEIDTDGVYFVPPPGIDTQAADEAYVASIGRTLPAGINLAFDGRYQGMLSLKTKNYVLLDYDGTLIVRGSSLRSRREEPYLRRFLYEAADLLVRGEREAVRALYFATARQIQQRALAPRDFCRWETITDKTFTSEHNRRLAAAAQGQRVGERIEVYQRATGALGPITEYANDEDVDYLLRRLRDVAARFSDIYEDAAAFDYAFPLLTATSDLDAREARTPVKQLHLF